MDIDKLNKWADLLLDTGKRNNLINFKDAKMGTVEIVSPDFDTLFSKAEHSATFEVYDPKLDDEEDDEEELLKSAKAEIENLSAFFKDALKERLKQPKQETATANIKQISENVPLPSNNPTATTCAEITTVTAAVNPFNQTR